MQAFLSKVSMCCMATVHSLTGHAKDVCLLLDSLLSHLMEEITLLQPHQKLVVDLSTLATELMQQHLLNKPTESEKSQWGMDYKCHSANGVIYAASACMCLIGGIAVLLYCRNVIQTTGCLALHCPGSVLVAQMKKLQIPQLIQVQDMNVSTEI